MNKIILEVAGRIAYFGIGVLCAMLFRVYNFNCGKEKRVN